MKLEIDNVHWMLSILQHMHNGLVVVDREYRICMWNSFMENHSGKTVDEVSGLDLFEVFPEVARDWLQSKIDMVFLLGCQAYTMWEERPYVFRFENYRPITGKVDFMYQYSSMLPLKGLDTKISHVAILITDVTSTAVQKLELTEANQRLSRMGEQRSG